MKHSYTHTRSLTLTHTTLSVFVFGKREFCSRILANFSGRRVLRAATHLKVDYELVTSLAGGVEHTCSRSRSLFHARTLSVCRSLCEQLLRSPRSSSRAFAQALMRVLELLVQKLSKACKLKLTSCSSSGGSL